MNYSKANIEKIFPRVYTLRGDILKRLAEQDEQEYIYKAPVKVSRIQKGLNTRWFNKQFQKFSRFKFKSCSLKAEIVGWPRIYRIWAQ